MAKYVYGYPTNKDKNIALLESLALVGGIEGKSADELRYTSEILETDVHKANNEYCIVIRTPEA